MKAASYRRSGLPGQPYPANEGSVLLPLVAKEVRGWIQTFKVGGSVEDYELKLYMRPDQRAGRT